MPKYLFCLGKSAIVVDIDARKREAAEKAGALATVDGKAPDALAQLAQKAGGPIRAVKRGKLFSLHQAVLRRTEVVERLRQLADASLYFFNRWTLPIAITA